MIYHHPRPIQKEPKKFSYFYEILSHDKKFMATVEDIYKNRHEGFNKGYQILNKNI